ncbi:MAG: hypothetical protein J6C98_01610 [Oscillospiraceae bacterium]|nr:hypothetical protein [Oscillospiraceae bacterium]
MRRVLYIIILIVMLILPAERMDIGDLLPVEVVQICEEAGVVRICTDTGNAGIGRNVPEAYSDMKNHANGLIFLDTAEYLILSGSAESRINELTAYLRPSVAVCRSQENINLEEAGKYLSFHNSGVRLSDAVQVEKIPLLIIAEEGFAYA